MERPRQPNGQSQSLTDREVEPAPPEPSAAEDKVGYGSPPKHSRFRKGVSGNPNGRKPGAKNFATLLKAALDARIVIKEGGKSRTMSRRDAIVRQLVSTSLRADLKATAMLLPLIQQMDAASEQQAERIHTADDEAVLKGLREQFGQEDDDDLS